jgi:RHS repeat-associated protein
MPGYAGTYEDCVTLAYSLGNGYRTYLPYLMRFSAPDSFSPFWLGGINPYAYCGDDPLNRSDPSGHMFLEEMTAEFAEMADSSVATAFKSEDRPLAVKNSGSAGQPSTSKGFANAAHATPKVTGVPDDPVTRALRHPDVPFDVKENIRSSAGAIRQYLDKVADHTNEINSQIEAMSFHETILSHVETSADLSINSGKIARVVDYHRNNLMNVGNALDALDAEIALARSDLKPNNSFDILWREDDELKRTIDQAVLRVLPLRWRLDRLLDSAMAELGLTAPPPP